MHTPGTQRVRDLRDLWDKIWRKNLRIRIYVADRAAVDSDGGEHATVLAHAAHIGARIACIPENRSSAVTALDRAVEVVPLVHPADRRVRRLLLVERRQRFAERDFAHQCERSVQDAAFIASG